MRNDTARFAAAGVSSAAVPVGALLLVIAVALAVAVPAFAADPPPAASPASADAQAKAKAQAEMDAYMKLAQPGEHHKSLGNLAGKWKSTGKTWMAPGQPPLEMTGTTEATWLLGGRYLQQVHTSSFMGQPFEGRSLDGYDNFAHEFFSTWIDTMGTGVMVFHGSCDEPCKVLTETAEAPDPLSGKVMKSKMVTTFIDPDTYRSEMYMVGKDGQEFKVMDLLAKRQK